MKYETFRLAAGCGLMLTSTVLFNHELVYWWAYLIGVTGGAALFGLGLASVWMHRCDHD